MYPLQQHQLKRPPPDDEPALATPPPYARSLAPEPRSESPPPRLYQRSMAPEPWPPTPLLIQHRMLAPKPFQPHSLAHSQRPKKTSFYDLPPELRIEIYRLVLDRVTVHILPPRTVQDRLCPHPLVQTSKQVRFEVLPIMHAQCPIRSTVTDFNFDGILYWISRLPPDQEVNLTKNVKLSIELVTTVSETKAHTSNSMRNVQSLRRWLHLRADRHRPQPAWRYKGPTPDPKTAYEMKRRAKRNTNKDEQREMCIMLRALGLFVQLDPPVSVPDVASPLVPGISAG